MPDYKDSKLYKITCNVSGFTYYGSTTNSLSRRMVQHRSDFKKGKLCKSKLVLAGGDYDYCLVEKVECSDKNELHKRERFYIESNECVNKQVPGRTPKEWRAENKEKKAEYMSEYRHEHRENLLKQMKEYNDAHKEENVARRAVKVTCECGCTVTKYKITPHRKSQKHINLMSQISFKQNQLILI